MSELHPIVQGAIACLIVAAVIVGIERARKWLGTK